MNELGLIVKRQNHKMLWLRRNERVLRCGDEEMLNRFYKK